jgi:hypothetical protein
MKVWTTTSFSGAGPVCVAAVVVADTAEHAAALLNDELERRGLSRDAQAAEMQRLPTSKQTALVLCDGDY